jgi:hypothetical protein
MGICSARSALEGTQLPREISSIESQCEMTRALNIAVFRAVMVFSVVDITDVSEELAASVLRVEEHSIE